MKIEVEIPDGKYCNGCPLLTLQHIWPDSFIHYCGILHKDLVDKNNKVLRDFECHNFKSEA